MATHACWLTIVLALLPTAIQCERRGAGQFWHKVRTAYRDPDEEYSRATLPPIPTEDFLRSSDAKAIENRILAVQNPEDCKTARYFLLDPMDPNHGNGPGWGWEFMMYAHHFYIAVAKGRTVVFVTAANPDWRWRWCRHPPYSYSCFFEEWSPCEPLFFQNFGHLNVSSVRFATDADHGADATQFVAFPEGHHLQTAQQGQVGEPIDWHDSIEVFRNKELHFGYFWWMAQAMRVMLQPKQWLASLVEEYLSKHGALNQPFIVMHVRRAQKAMELELTPMEKFAEAAEKAMSCYKTHHVHLVTESEEAVGFYVDWANRNNVNLFYTNNTRAEVDVWNARHQPGFASADAVMDEQGLVAALNLLIAGRGSMLVLQGSMYAYHGKPRPMLSFQGPMIDGHGMYRYAYLPHEGGMLIDNIEDIDCEAIARLDQE